MTVCIDEVIREMDSQLCDVFVKVFVMLFLLVLDNKLQSTTWHDFVIFFNFFF